MYCAQRAGLACSILKGAKNQYGKTTILQELADYLKDSYLVVSLDFRRMSTADFASESWPSCVRVISAV